MRIINFQEPVIYGEEIEESKKKLRSETEEDIKNRLYDVCDIMCEADYNSFIFRLQHYLKNAKKKEYKKEVFRRIRNNYWELSETHGVYTGANAITLSLWSMYETAIMENLMANQEKLFESIVDRLCEEMESTVFRGGNVSASHVNMLFYHANEITKGLHDVLESQIQFVAISDVMGDTPLAVIDHYFGEAAGKQSIIVNRSEGDDDGHLLRLVLGLCEVMYDLCGEELEDVTEPLLEHMEGDFRHFEDVHKEIITLMACGYSMKANLQLGEDALLAGMFGLEYAQSEECHTIVNNLIEFVGNRLVEQYLDAE